MASQVFISQAHAQPVYSTAIGRARATAINSVLPVRQAGTKSGINRRVPLLYGECRVEGVYLARPVVDSGYLILCIGWSMGEIEGVEEIYINGRDVPMTGVTITHYTGTDAQTVDSDLAAAIPGFADDFKDVAYSVIKIHSSAAVDGWPRVEAVVKGIKCYDPRTEITEYTLNPALQMLDFMTRADVEMIGIEAVADFCDSEYQGDARSEAGLYIDVGITIDQAKDLFTAYAECLAGWDGGKMLVVPDAQVDTMPVYGCGGVRTDVGAYTEHDFGAEGGVFTAGAVGITIELIADDENGNQYVLDTKYLNPLEQYEIDPSYLSVIVTMDEAAVLL